MRVLVVKMTRKIVVMIGLTVEVIGTLLVARKREGVFRRQTMGVAVRLILLSYRHLYLVSCPSPYVWEETLSVRCPFYGLWGGFNAPSQVARYLVAGVLTGVGCGD